MAKLDWRRAQHPGRGRLALADEAEHFEKDQAAKWLDRAARPSPKAFPGRATLFPRSAVMRKGKPIEQTCRCGCKTAKFIGKRGTTVACSACRQHITQIHDARVRRHILETHSPAGSDAGRAGAVLDEQQRLAHFKTI